MICQQQAMKFSAKHKQSIYFELGKFVGAGFGFDKACEAILAQPGAPVCQKVFCTAVLDGLNTKKTIGQAIAGAPLNISPLEINLISAGEEAGMLEQSFAHLAGHFERSVETRRKILRGLAYPVVLLHAGAILGTLAISMLTAWNPQAQAGDGWRVFTTGVAILLCTYLVAIVGGFLVAGWIQKARTSPAADRLLSAIPLLGGTVGNLAMSRFCEVFEMSLHSGRKIDHCLRTAGAASESGVLIAASEAGASLIKQGDSLAEALSSNPESFPADFRRSVANAELAGVLDEDFQRWSDHYRKTAVEAVDRLTEWCPRLFYWGVLLVVAFVVIRMAMAYRGLLEGYLDWSDQF